MAFLFALGIIFITKLCYCHYTFRKESKENACCNRQTRSRSSESESGSMAETQEAAMETTQEATIEATQGGFRGEQEDSCV